METRTKGKRTHLVSLDKTEEEVRRLAESLTNRNEFLLDGKNVHPSQVRGASFFRTTKPAAELILLNRRSIADYKKSECKPLGCCKHRYIATCLSKGKITEANDCTQEFIASKRRRNNQKKT